MTDTDKTFACFDIDGVLADHRHRLGLLKTRAQWERYFALSSKDRLSPKGLELLLAWSERADVVLTTGRPRREAARTKDWLSAVSPEEIDLGRLEVLHRKDDDRRPGAAVKAGMRQRLRQRGSIAVVVDDDAAVLKLARSEGLEVVHATWVTKAH